MMARDEERERAGRSEDEEIVWGDHYLPTIALVKLPHPSIPHLYQLCFEYLEPWDWSPVAELVETGRWFFDQRPEPPRRNRTQ